MKTILNIILGLGTAIIVGSLIYLGIRAFHPEPVSPHERNVYPKSLPYREFVCEKGDKECVADREKYLQEQQVQQEEFARLDREYQEKLKVYNRDVFIIANIVGTLVFGFGFLILFKTVLASQSIPVGIMLAGLWSIIYGYSRGWNSIDDKLKFFVGLVIAVMVIGGSIWLMQKYHGVKKR